MSHHYQIINLDVIPTEDGGYELNNLYESGFFIQDAPEDLRREDVVCALKVLTYLKPFTRQSNFDLEWIGDGYELSHREHGPICHLRELDDELFELKTSSKWMFDRPLVYVDAKIFNWGKMAK